MLDEFKKFAIRGNVVDLAMGVIFGTALGSAVNSLVGDLLMPVVSAVTGGLDFSNYFTALSPKVTADSLAEARKQGAVLAWEISSPSSSTSSSSPGPCSCWRGS